MRYKNLILTISDYYNYGNRLQNYALRVLLDRYGLTTTIYSCIDDLSSERKKIDLLKDIIKRVYSLLFSDSKSLRYQKNRKFRNMSMRFIPDDCFMFSMKRGLISNQHDTFDTLVIGSDQVWNFKWLTKRGVALRLGSFVSNDHSVISYAASFGVSEIDDDVKPIFQKYLPRFKAISVREDRGAELVKEMTGLDATVVLDPTLMLPMNKWLEITENFVPDDDRYILTYFLGRPSDEQERDIQAYAKAHDCHVRRIFDLRDKETYVAGPQDFVELFSKAQYVFTDSYHACCFSILFHKQFTVFNRAGMNGKSNMNSRMETLFRLFDLDSVMIDSGLAPEIDYERVDHLLEENRRKSRNWLDKAMEG
ncbi:polysaccharide pyruvyl transferase family protein [Bifidobacterium moukalabense]|uniref:polysaccharide pyruvyl transferase family protein n=1 Tax=Bifidobacterium moukalabense TaxID=1333651 RepID=UPI0010F43EA2|nr:polysaccharide pyruvyl transferase family protein [Bifidobacterium moukalabense]